jgi:hypothetical protein
MHATLHNAKCETGEAGNKRHLMLRDELSKFFFVFAQPGKMWDWLKFVEPTETRDELSKLMFSTVQPQCTVTMHFVI